MNFIRIFIITLLVSSPATTVWASSASVANDISVSVSTGGNSANGGQNGGNAGNVVNGKASASVQVKTVINGKTYEDFGESFSSDQSFEKSFSVSDSGNQSSTTIRVNARSGSTSIKALNAARTRTEVKRNEVKKRLEEEQRNLEKKRDDIYGRISSTTSATTSARFVTTTPRVRGSYIKSFISKIINNVFSIFSR